MSTVVVVLIPRSPLLSWLADATFILITTLFNSAVYVGFKATGAYSPEVNDSNRISDIYLNLT